MSDRAGSIETFLAEIKKINEEAEKIEFANLTALDKEKLLYYYHEWCNYKNDRISVNTVPKGAFLEMIEGLIVLGKYQTKEYKASISAEHDIIYAGSYEDNERMTDTDKLYLEKLGWHWNEEGDSWALFT